MSDYLGKQFGNYHLVKLLGEGGFAQVYLGEHIHLGIQAAVKVLTTRLAEDEVALFRNEARTMIGLKHPNIIRVLDFGIEGSIPFIIMDYAPKESLRKLHPRGTRLPLSIIVNYVKQIADALQYVHELKLIHRDIKPENILLGLNNEVLLSDFGIAAIALSTNSLITKDGSGTIYYMSPEQIQGKARTASDQYSLGIVVYEWLSGVRPFNGTYWEVASQHLSTPPPSLQEKVPAIPFDVEQVVITALAKDPKQRFRSVQAFAKAMEDASKKSPFGKLQGLPTDGRPVMSSSWHNLDEAFFNIAEGIRKAAEEIDTEAQINQSVITAKTQNKLSAHHETKILGSAKRLEIEKKLKKIIADQLGVDESKVVPNASFVGDLNADSLNTVELLVAVEDAFTVMIPDEDVEKISTVQEALEYLQEHLV